MKIIFILPFALWAFFSSTESTAYTGTNLINKTAFGTSTVSFTPTAIGWYRIASSAVPQGGRIEISGTYDNRATDVEFQYNMGTWGIGGSVQQTRYSSFNHGVVDQIRISSDGTANSYLDIHISSATSPTAITITGSGALMPAFIASPVVGANAGTGFSAVLTLNHGFNTTAALTSYGGSATWLAVPSVSMYYEKSADLGMINSWHPSVSWKPLHIKAANISFLSYDILGLYQDASGKVGIGTTTPREALSVNGTVRAKEMKVELANWPDYVFKPNYRLPLLSEVKDYIDKHQHLPEMPSETEVAKNGISLGDIAKLQTKKIEELTLYLIEKDKQIRMQKEENAKIKTELNQLKQQQDARISALEKLLLK
ncbi:MAG: hypothetical protein V4619_00165 [Bacteroidota bacterium]